MNKLIIGLADKTAELIQDEPGFLLIDDGPIADAFLQTFTRAKQFNPHSHSFNPLPMTYRKARDFAEVVFGEKDLMTYRNGKRALTRLVQDAKRLDKLRGERTADEQEALAAVEDLLISPVLRSVLCKATTRWVFSGASIIARIDRAVLGDHDARILGALLISQFKGQIILPDFGFYARPFHISLIRENRLIAGVYTLSELDPKLRQMCLLMPKEAVGCNFDDAEVLAKYAGHIPGTNAYNAEVAKAMS